MGVVDVGGDILFENLQRDELILVEDGEELSILGEMVVGFEFSYFIPTNLNI